MAEPNNAASESGRRILYVQYTNPAGYPPLEHSSRILADNGSQVLFLGTGAFGANNLRFAEHNNIRVKLMQYASPGWRQKLHYVQFCFWVFIWAIIWRPDWVYASDPLSTPIALLLTYLPIARIIYHEHDSPSRPGSRFFRLCLRARQHLAGRATMCVLPNQTRVDRFTAETGTGVPVFCVWNCPPMEDASSDRNHHLNSGLRILYHGSIVPLRLPLTVINAVAMLPSRVTLRIVGYETIGHQGYQQQIRALASALGIANRIEILGALVSRSELMACARECDIGLSLISVTSDDVNLHSMAGASNKPFDYLACGLALLVSNLPAWREFFVKPGYGLSCDPRDPQDIAASLRWYLERPEEVRSMGEKGRHRIFEEWNYEQQFAPVLARMSCKPR